MKFTNGHVAEWVRVTALSHSVSFQVLIPAKTCIKSAFELGMANAAYTLVAEDHELNLK